MRTIFEVLEILANDPIGPNSLNAGPTFPTQAKDAEKEIIKSFPKTQRTSAINTYVNI